MTREEWEKLEPVTKEAIDEGHEVINRAGNSYRAKWYEGHPRPLVINANTSFTFYDVGIVWRMAPKKPERIVNWVTLYSKSIGGLHITEEKANLNAVAGCLGVLPVTLERTPNGGWKVLGTEDLEREQ